MPTPLFNSLIKVKNSSDPSHSQFELFLTHLPELQKYSQVEVTVSYYPYDHAVDADAFHFDPYEDYVFELAEGKRSTYQLITDGSPQLAGILLGGAILIYFAVFFPELLISVESVVSIFAAYTVGKEIWRDVDSSLQNVSSSWPIRWIQQTYYYGLQQFGTLHRFWQFARQRRYEYQLTLPAQIDFLSHSNSKTVEMLFTKTELSHPDEEAVRVLSVSFNTKVVKNISSSLPGLLICRVAVVRKFLGIKFATEFYQSLDNGVAGTLDTDNMWHANKSLEKDLVSWGRLVWVSRHSTLINQSIVTKE